MITCVLQRCCWSYTHCCLTQSLHDAPASRFLSGPSHDKLATCCAVFALQVHHVLPHSRQPDVQRPFNGGRPTAGLHPGSHWHHDLHLPHGVWRQQVCSRWAQRTALLLELQLVGQLDAVVMGGLCTAVLVVTRRFLQAVGQGCSHVHAYSISTCGRLPLHMQAYRPCWGALVHDRACYLPGS
jgi:hypothetical protein